MKNGTGNGTIKSTSELIDAVCNGRTDIVDQMIKAGADVNSPGDNDETALMAASKQGNSEILELLLDSGADVNKQDHNGDTALYFRCAERP